MKSSKLSEEQKPDLNLWTAHIEFVALVDGT